MLQKNVIGHSEFDFCEDTTVVYVNHLQRCFKLGSIISVSR